MKRILLLINFLKKTVLMKVRETKGQSQSEKIDYDTIKVDQWVKVIHKEDVFVGIVREKKVAMSRAPIQYQRTPALRM